MKLAIVCLLFVASTVAAFVTPSATSTTPRSFTTELNAERSGRRAFFTSAAVTAATAAIVIPLPALADREYANIPYLGGSNIVDINNANVRVYLKMPGLYPTVAGKIVTNGPYASVNDIYNIPGLTGKEKDLLKKYESRFTAQKPSADYVIDKFNNGLYR